MREIKFRAYIRELKKIYTITGLHYMGGSISEVAIFDGGQFNWFHILDVDLMQYTGFKDKNGKEIYEGDICKKTYGSSTPVFTVAYHDARGMFIMQDGYNEPLYTVNNSMIEVIGNIYENPKPLNP